VGVQNSRQEGPRGDIRGSTGIRGQKNTGREVGDKNLKKKTTGGGGKDKRSEGEMFDRFHEVRPLSNDHIKWREKKTQGESK